MSRDTEVIEQNQDTHGLGRADEQYIDAGYINDDGLDKAHQNGRLLMPSVGYDYRI
jgi:hypothetical protein